MVYSDQDSSGVRVDSDRSLRKALKSWRAGSMDHAKQVKLVHKRMQG